MADILIRIEKPKNCFLCRFFREIQDYDGTFCCCIAAKKEISWDFDDCFFPSLPERHGRLGDLDKLEESLRMMAAYQTGERQQGILGCCETIRMAKSIVTAEGGGEDD